MPNVPFSLRLDPALKERLKAEAKKADRSTSYLATKAIEVFLHSLETKRAAIETALKEADKGEFVSQDAVHEWVSGWGRDDEMPLPDPDILPGDKKP